MEMRFEQVVNRQIIIFFIALHKTFFFVTVSKWFCFQIIFLNTEGEIQKENKRCF